MRVSVTSAGACAIAGRAMRTLAHKTTASRIVAFGMVSSQGIELSAQEAIKRATRLVEERPPMLSPYRVLDLTDERGLLCGKILADLGADVIQIEPPQGNSARRIGPFYQDEVHPDRGLYWWAYATN